MKLFEKKESPVAQPVGGEQPAPVFVAHSWEQVYDNGHKEKLQRSKLSVFNAWTLPALKYYGVFDENGNTDIRQFYGVEIERFEEQKREETNKKIQGLGVAEAVRVVTATDKFIHSCPFRGQYTPLEPFPEPVAQAIEYDHEKGVYRLDHKKYQDGLGIYARTPAELDVYGRLRQALDTLNSFTSNKRANVIDFLFIDMSKHIIRLNCISSEAWAEFVKINSNEL